MTGAVYSHEAEGRSYLGMYIFHAGINQKVILPAKIPE